MSAQSEKPSQPQTADVLAFFDEDSNTFSYVVKDPSSSSCAVSALKAPTP